MSKFTRRELAAALSTCALSTSAVFEAQAQASPEDELKTARTQLRDNADQLDKFPLPMATEPATTFKP
jgi:hypothetical protein